MGQTLSVPATDKISTTGGDARFLYAVSEMQGWRISMEDTHAHVLELEEGTDKPNSFFAVYDGHGGSAASKFAGQAVHKRLTTEVAYREGRWADAMKDAFLGADADLKADPGHARDPSGCTAVATLVTHDRKLICANAGDSRAVLSVGGEVKPLSYDHKPQSETEKQRIAAAGGYVEYGRVNGNLALSRALGDFEYKKNPDIPPEEQIITANPDIIIHELTDEDEFAVIACDGIWDCLTSQQVINIVRRKIAEGLELKEITELLCSHCLAPDTSSGAGIGCDNMTAMVVAFLNGRTKEEWYSWIADRVERQHGYPTPTDLPQLYAPSRLQAFRARQQAREAREERDRSSGGGINSGENGPMGSILGGPLGGTLGGFARVLGSAGGITFHPGSGIISDTGSLMFDKYDSDEDEEVDGDDGSTDVSSFFGNSFGGGISNSSLREQLASLDDMSDEGDVDMDNIEAKEPAADGQTKGPRVETPLPSSVHLSDPNDAKPVEQLKSAPGGDAPTPAVQAEGLMDKSEDPLKQ